jgi:exopolysaccharide production protein ExoZ
MRNDTDARLLVNVQFLRFIAASLVLLYHGAQGISEKLAIDNSFRDACLLIGFSGVDLFFVISGFIIYTSNRHGMGFQHAMQFISLRAARIFLGYWPFFFIAWSMLHSLSPEKLERVNLVSSFFLLPDKIYATLINVTWSLSFELYFYCIFFALLFVKNRFWIIMLMAAAVLCFGIFSNYVLNAYSWSGFKNLSDTARFITSPWLLEFFAGCTVAHIIGKGSKDGAWLAVMAGIALFVLGGALNATVMDGKIAKFFNYQYRMTIFGGGSALLIYGLVILEQGGMLIFPRFSLLLGGASYSLYLCHTIILDAIEYSGLQAWLIGATFPPLLMYIALLLLIQAIAVVFYLLVEKPVYSLAKQWAYTALSPRITS